MKRYLRELKPSQFDDIIAMVALYRPGPMQFIDDFIDRKHGRKEVTYEHSGMEAALGNTYGILVYQEQFMQISKDMCGFTGGQADTLRKAIGKKQRETMAKMQGLFIEGMVNKSGVSQSFAENFWHQLEAFADYCFNKSHSACYGLIAYQTAYLKANYPSAFMAALLTSDFGNIDRIAIEVAECQHMGITVLPPDVNQSFLEFAVVPETGDIRFGLSAIKNIGTAPIEAILRAREEGGPFKNLQDFATRVSARECNRKVWESLTKCGAFDTIAGVDRATLLHNLDLITSYAAKAQKNALSGQIDIFGSLGVADAAPDLRLDPAPVPVSNREQLAWEKELMGLYLSHHPLDDYAAYLTDTTQPIGRLTPEADGKIARIGGLVTTVRKILTKKGDAMAFVGIEDKTGSTELVVFPKAYAAAPEVYEPDNIIMASGKISARDRDGSLNGEPKIMVDNAKIINYDLARNHTPLKPVAPAPQAAPTPPSQHSQRGKLPYSAPPTGQQVVLVVSQTSDDMLHALKDVIRAHPGGADMYLQVGGSSGKKLRLPFRVDASDELAAALKQIAAGSLVTRT
jgi:DNA polymerase-3 subunit alpha